LGSADKGVENAQVTTAWLMQNLVGNDATASLSSEDEQMASPK